MEAAASGTPSAALAVGGLPESIVDGETGVLAHDPEELVKRTRAVLADAALRARLGSAAYERAQAYTWEATAERTLAVLRAEAGETGEQSTEIESRASEERVRAAV
jgi:glycosyltransferase involved in cell wall biosynthesis